jgi:hypothetical protein
MKKLFFMMLLACMASLVFGVNYFTEDFENVAIFMEKLQ